MVIFYCPICSNELSEHEALVVSRDARGKLIVHHMIPADIPIDSSVDTDNLRTNIRIHPQKDVRMDSTSSEFTPMRSCCGKAGYKSFSVT